MSIALLAIIINSKSQYTKYKLNSVETISICRTSNISGHHIYVKLSNIRALTKQRNRLEH